MLKAVESHSVKENTTTNFLYLTLKCSEKPKYTLKENLLNSRHFNICIVYVEAQTYPFKYYLCACGHHFQFYTSVFLWLSKKLITNKVNCLNFINWLSEEENDKKCQYINQLLNGKKIDFIGQMLNPAYTPGLCLGRYTIYWELLSFSKSEILSFHYAALKSTEITSKKVAEYVVKFGDAVLLLHFYNVTDKMLQEKTLQRINQDAFVLRNCKGKSIHKTGPSSPSNVQWFNLGSGGTVNRSVLQQITLVLKQKTLSQFVIKVCCMDQTVIATTDVSRNSALQCSINCSQDILSAFDVRS